MARCRNDFSRDAQLQAHGNFTIKTLRKGGGLFFYSLCRLFVG